MFEKILVAVDGSECGLLALDLAIELQKATSLSYFCCQFTSD